MLKRASAILFLLHCAHSQAANWSVTPNANLQFDWASFRPDRFQFEDADHFRRARFSFSAKYDDAWELRAEYDLKPNAWTDLYAKRLFANGHSLRVGQFKQPVYLDELTSDRVTLFMEQGLPSAFAIGRRLGAEYGFSKPRYTLAATAFGQNLTGSNDGLGFALRGTWLACQSERSLLHLGASAATENPDSNSSRFSVRPEAALAQRALVDTRAIAGVERISRIGLEAAWIHGPWLLQSEYLRAGTNRDAGDFSGSGYYVQGSWFPSGHHRLYKNGAIDGPDLTQGNAWEIALRHSHVDLNDDAIHGGEESNWTLGVNWYPNKNWRFIANYVRVESETAAGHDDPRILEFRAQLAF